MTTQPNILLITSDQQRGDCYGFEGRRVKTPHLDQLARDGTRFGACITPNVVCQPSRASILTGLLPRTHGVWDNGVDLDDPVGEAGFAGQLGKAGYDAGFIGKAHFSTFHTFSPTGKPENRASTAQYGPDWFGPYMAFNHVELMVGGHNIHLPQHPPEGQHYERWFHADGLGEDKIRLYKTHLRPMWVRRRPGTPRCRPPGTIPPGAATVPSSSSATIRQNPSSCGLPSPTPTIRSTRRNHGAACIIPTMSICRGIVNLTSSVAPGGIGPAWNPHRNSPILTCAISASATPGHRARLTSNCVT